MSAPGLQAFHIGIVVRSVDATANLYGRILGIDKWRITEAQHKKSPWNDWMTDSRFKVAYGRAAYQTIELVEVLEGRQQYTRFLEEHGEGVQHIGFWCPDIQTAVSAAVAEGAEIVAASIDEQQNAVVQLKPGSSTSDIVGALDQGFAYLNLGMGSVQFEFLGPNSGRGGGGLREWLAERYKQDRSLAPVV